MKIQPQEPYQNNPFFIAVNGLNLLFRAAQNIAILGLVIAGFSLLLNYAQTAIDASNPANQAGLTNDERIEAQEKQITDFVQQVTTASVEQIMLVSLAVVTVIIVIFIAGSFLSAIFDYTSAKLAKGDTVSFKQAISGATKRFGSYIWLQINISVRIFLWSLLFIVPGIYKAVRYTLSGVVFYSGKPQSAAASINRSEKLVQGAWLTTFASHMLFNLITLGVISTLLTPGTNAILYRQYTQLEHNKQSKPKAHMLSWLTVSLPIVGVTLVLLTIAALITYGISQL